MTSWSAEPVEWSPLHFRLGRDLGIQCHLSHVSEKPATRYPLPSHVPTIGYLEVGGKSRVLLSLPTYPIYSVHPRSISALLSTNLLLLGMRRVFVASWLTLLVCMGWQLSSVRRSERGRLSMALEVPLIPAILLSSAAVFAVFNIENKADLTDEGRRRAKKARREAKIAAGQEVRKKESNADPYAYRLFADDDDDIDMFPRKTGGGCG